MAYASDKNAYGISDRSGFRYRLKDMRVEWTGAKVGKDEFETKHPQLFPPRVGPDPQALKNPRPESNLEDQRNFQYGWNPVGGIGDGILTPNTFILKGEVGNITVAISPSQEDVANVQGVFGSSNVGAVAVVVSGVAVSGVAGTGAVGSAGVIAGSAPRFDSTSITLDSTTDTFDEG